MTMLLLLLIIASACAGILYWRKNKVYSLLFFLPLLIVAGFISWVVYQSYYHTTPDSVQFSVKKENNTYTVEGEWREALDAYRFPSDFLVFYVPDNKQVKGVHRQKVNNYTMDSFIEEEVSYWAAKETDSKLLPQIYDIKTSKHFTITFELPDHVNKEEVKLYYGHAREEPMDALEFWFKEVDLTTER